MRVMRLATAAVGFAIGILVVTWAGYAYWVAARGGAGDLTAAGWSIFATIGVLVGVGFIYLAWRASRQVRAIPSLPLGISDYSLATGLIVVLIALLVGTPGHAAGFVVVMGIGCGLIAYGLISLAIRLIGR